MSYAHQKDEIYFIDKSAGQSVAVKAARAVGMKPLQVRSFWATVTTQNTVTAAIYALKYRPTPGSSSGEVVIATLTIPTSAAIGKQVYKKNLDYKALPGGELVVELTQASTAGAQSIGCEVDPTWENPATGNNTNQIASA